MAEPVQITSVVCGLTSVMRRKRTKFERITFFVRREPCFGTVLVNLTFIFLVFELKQCSLA